MARDFNAVLKDNPTAGDVHIPAAGGNGKPKKPRGFAEIMAAKRAAGLVPSDGSLYVHRKLKNADDLYGWAKTAGIPNIVPPHEMHVTQVYSRAPVALQPLDDTVKAEGGDRRIAPLGDQGAQVLHFQNQQLQDRFGQAKAAGASFDHEGGYKPHVTISYDAGGKDLSGIKPPDFPLVFGPEVHAPIQEDWAKAKGLRKFDFNFVIAKNDAGAPMVQEDRCLAFGWGSVISDGDTHGADLDCQGDEITEDDVEKAFYDFAVESRQADDMHDWSEGGPLVECMVFTKEKEKLGLMAKNADGKPMYGAWVGFRLRPDIFAKVKSGEYKGWSIGGSGVRVAH